MHIIFEIGKASLFNTTFKRDHKKVSQIHIRIGGDQETLLHVANSGRYFNYFELNILFIVNFMIIYYGSKKNTRFQALS